MYLDEKQIDWKALRVAKIAMVRLGELDIPRLPLTDLERASCNQMIYLLDYIQDQAEETAIDTPKSEIFTHAELEEDCENLGIEYDLDVNNAPFHLLDDNNEWIDAFMTEEKARDQQEHIFDFSGVKSHIVTQAEWFIICHSDIK